MRSICMMRSLFVPTCLTLRPFERDRKGAFGHRDVRILPAQRDAEQRRGMASASVEPR
jgi:hypothetical protein